MDHKQIVAFERVAAGDSDEHRVSVPAHQVAQWLDFLFATYGQHATLTVTPEDPTGTNFCIEMSPARFHHCAGKQTAVA